MLIYLCCGNIRAVSWTEEEFSVKKEITYKVRASEDMGNSEQVLRLAIGDHVEEVRQPNVFGIEFSFDTVGDKPDDVLINNLMDDLFISLNSPAVRMSKNYYIGKAALEHSEVVNSMRAGKVLKSKSDIPVVNTLGVLAAKGVQRAFDQNKEIPTTVNLEVDFVTALPVTEYKKDGAKEKLRDKFMNGPHEVIVYVGVHKVTVNINFEYVFVSPEGTAAIFSVAGNKDRTKDIVAQFTKEYDIDTNKALSLVKKGKILHVDIGEGTTELPITEGHEFDDKKAMGINVGIAMAINQALGEFKEQSGFPNISRQKYSEYLKHPKKYPEYHKEALSYIRQSVAAPIQSVFDAVTEQLDRVYNEVDVVMVYGGGSVLMKEYLYDMLKEELEDRKNGSIKLLWVPTEYATTMNIDGLDMLFKNGIYDQLKKRQMQGSK